MLKGQAISPGYALGKAYCLKHFQLESVVTRSVADQEIDQEISRFQTSLHVSKTEISQLVDLPQIKSSLEIANIFKAHLALIDDPDLKKEILKRLRESRQNAEAVVSKVIKDYSDFFRSLPDVQFQEKAIDIMDIGRRILKNFQQNDALKDIPDSKDGLIIIAEDISPSDIVGLEGVKILGIATSEGTATSHASIMARTLGIPALIQVKGLLQEVSHGAFVVIDGNAGTVVNTPDAATQQEYERRQKDFEIRKKNLQENLLKPSRTKDGVEIRLCANIGQKQDVDSVLQNQAQGVGLYRTEFTYLTRKRFPTEDELLDIYHGVVQRLNGAEIVIRTIDLGGDKISHLVGGLNEKNPELGWRAVRMSLDRLDLFRTQLRGLLKTIAHNPQGNIKVLFPMISNVGELRRAKAFLQEVKEELEKEGVVFPSAIPIGAMVEVPSAALLADKLAREVDFLSIGSNDLVQYTLAVDRTNSRVAHLYQPTNPAVLMLIRLVIEACERHSKRLCICGELAGDWRYTLLLIGLGMRELSMNAGFIPRVKQVVRSISAEEAQKRVLPLLEMDTAEEIEEHLRRMNSEFGLE
jgi:phosphotransferase system enzyme I (PtsI)